ncbi:hypothetical protein E1281_34800 [Actinomadura sp. KC345]|uniref:hypothetical protein n=1 Tax=Actinomadura sp. KC345 TaxID=2530371 RepID=UPI001047B03E|nr:hypothetical protein [Actinomadura sp. KC345]TDC43775.1 hypothetical protein E1281_34800 [Actinomadura sp. KC345]
MATTDTDNDTDTRADTDAVEASETEPATAEAEAEAEESGADEIGEDTKEEGAKEEGAKEEGAKKQGGKEEGAKKQGGKEEAVEVGEGGKRLGERAWARMPGRARLPGKAGLVKATVAVALVGSVITAGLQWYQADRAAERDAERRQVRASAAEFGEALLSYDHTKLQQTRDRVLALASDDFAKTYDEAFTGGLEGVITKLKADATATVRTVYLGEIESGTAKAVVVMDSEVKSTSGTRRVLGSYLDMRLTRRGEEWKITEVTSVGAANETMTNPEGEQQKPDSADPSPAPSP